jgi:hypothetical protein
MALADRQLRRRMAEVPAARRLQPVVPVAVVGDPGVEPENLGLAVGGVQLDGQGYLPEFDGKTELARRVGHLRQLLLYGRAALVLAAGELARGGAADGERVEPGSE